jgi:hypothetical protein
MESASFIKEALYMRSRGQLAMDLLPEMPSTLGMDWYTAEFWVVSHPTLEPCDVSSVSFEHRYSHDADANRDF